jgi:conjugative relaxase-like TrwC/TraI family protein
MVVRLTKITPSYARYLAKESPSNQRAAGYYVKDAPVERPGVFLGTGTEALLGHPEGARVTERELTALLDGFSPVTGEPLVQNAGSESRKSWELTVDASKAYSVVWAIGSPETRRDIEDQFFAAAEIVVQRVEDLVFTRRGSEGARCERGDITIAAFLHTTSRAPSDPHLHFHLVLPNLAVRSSDGTTGTIVSRPLYQAARELDALFKAELEQRLGHYREELDRIPESLLDAFSTRRKQIIQAVGEGASSQERQLAALKTRDSKQAGTHFERWLKVAHEHGYSVTEQVRSEHNANRTHERSLDELFPELTPEEKARFQTTEPSRTATAHGADRSSAFHRMADAAVAKIEEARSAIWANLTVRMATAFSPDALLKYQGPYNLKDPLRPRAWWERETLREKAARLLSAESIARNLTFQPIQEDLSRKLGLDQEHGHGR